MLGHKTVLVNKQNSHLLEVTSDGARNEHFREDYRLKAEELSFLLYEKHVKGSLWTVYDFYEENLFSDHENRTYIWPTAVEELKVNPIFGNGINNAQIALHNRYPKKGAFGAICQKIKLDAHNEFLQITLEMGVIGLILILTIFTVLIRLEIKDSLFNNLSLVFAITFILFFNVESVLNTYFGLSFFSFFYTFFVKYSIHKKTNLVNQC